ncbi:hypothetical protein GL213_14480 [Halogeometricum borinquense]|uniref:Uncharacterized protein n=2 Tax=Halogeometricum borinquense TaxID=60847 RepID=E4NMG1_HALBP|nr:hypothetical protein [Halogeometricum borinquense]ADQ68459.1 hypothetical protein Hbor_29200 [Halogeometricum borinquense DSM 11551]ELY27897.1 hypothetical protein C499_08637 [Halogeometricum borinquense DSM 11551]QIB75731.1 hypothetical protein G3I44_16445 [Halogeometricum borinquense]QIQ77619.1 hypothetical protein GL213_14480 [Halogeometricum borinquense]RYJ15009.1 hypothetical protein ELS19_14325 [Halogeometricum borinquense]
MTVTHYDVVEGRIALSLMLGLLAVALLAHLIVSSPVSFLPALIALGGLAVLTIQNGLIYLSQVVGSEKNEAEGTEIA